MARNTLTKDPAIMCKKVSAKVSLPELEIVFFGYLLQ